MYLIPETSVHHVNLDEASENADQIIIYPQVLR